MDGVLETYVALGGLVDLAQERARLEKELARAEKDPFWRRAHTF